MLTLVIGLAIGVAVGMAAIGYGYALATAWQLGDDCGDDE
jgi:hypothetical protein